MQLIGIWALVAATLGPIQNVLGWTLSGLLMPNYDPVAKTISDLAADDSPVKWIQTGFFYFGGSLTIIAAWSAKALAPIGRAALLLAGLATYGFAFFATPTQFTSSEAHRIFASVAFILFSAWPLLAMRFDKAYHWSLRPIGAVPATLILTAMTVWFLLTWLEPGQPIVGLSERVIAVAQVLWLSAVIWMQYLHQKRLGIKAVDAKSFSSSRMP